MNFGRGGVCVFLNVCLHMWIDVVSWLKVMAITKSVFVHGDAVFSMRYELIYFFNFRPKNIYDTNV